MRTAAALFTLVMTILGNYAYAEYPDAERDRPKILEAAQINNVEVKNLRFPLSKQLITGPLTAISKIPELVGYVLGSDDGFATLHTIVFEQGQNKLTCGALVTLKPDNTWYVSVSSCGSNHVQYFSNKTPLIPTTQVH